MSESLPMPKSLWVNVKFELDFFSYVTKADLKNATGVDTSNFSKKVYLASFNEKFIN